MTAKTLNALWMAAAVATVLAGCASNPARDLAIAAGMTGAEPKPPPDFISRARRTDLDYIPVGTSAPKRIYRPKTPGEVGTAQNELQAEGAKAAAQ